jgi:hypothetical protein
MINQHLHRRCKSNETQSEFHRKNSAIKDNLMQGLSQELKHIKGFDGRSNDHAYAHIRWRKTEILSWCDEQCCLANGATTEINWTPSMSREYRGRWACSTHQQDLKRKYWHRCRIWLDCEQQSEIVNLGLFWEESHHDTNTRVIEYFSYFQRLFARPDTINGLEVMQFWSRPVY